LWAQDQAYAPGSFGYSGGTQFLSSNPIAGTSDDILFQSERYGGNFTYQFDAPRGQYEIQLLDADTANNNPGDRVFNVFVEGQQVLTNFDIIATAGGKNTAVTVTLTNTMTDGQLTITFAGVAGHTDPNARISAVRVRKIADLDSVGDGIPDWWRAANFGGSGTTSNSSSCATCDPDGDGVTNLQEFRARTNPLNANSALTATLAGSPGPAFSVQWPSVAGKKYRIYYSDDLQTTWTMVVPDVLATGSLSSWPDPGPLPPHRFYKVQILP
jgi:hypothetical protein